MNKPYQVLHLSHTYVAVDARILKEMHALHGSDLPIDLHGLGVVMRQGNADSSLSVDLQLDAIELRSRSMTWLPRLLRHFLTFPEYMFKICWRATRYRPRIVHCHDILALPVGVLLKLFYGTKIIYDAHELESDMNNMSRLIGRMVFSVEWCLWRFVDQLITVSPSIAQWYRDHLGEKPTTLIYNSPLQEDSEQTASFGPNYLREQFGIPEDAKIFIYVGFFGRGRGIEQLIEMFKQIPEAHLVFLGHGWMEEYIVDAIADQANIHFHASVPHEQVVSVVRSADVGFCMIGKVSLSDYYCLPNKLFEYIFAGVAVIASDFPDIRRMVDAYQLGVCCEQDPASIQAAVESIVRGQTAIDVDTSRLRDLSWEAQSEKLVGLYRSLIEQFDDPSDPSASDRSEGEA